MRIYGFRVLKVRGIPRDVQLVIDAPDDEEPVAWAAEDMTDEAVSALLREVLTN